MDTGEFCSFEHGLHLKDPRQFNKMRLFDFDDYQ